MERKGTPIFVKLEEYKDILDILAMIKTKTNDAKVLLHKINELKKEEESSLTLWQKELEEIDRTVDAIDKMLYVPDS
ncbi:MAG: hypothetical protein QF632_00055 [Candidatus Woesearchaeota archaeon]|jgi:hypothetical protein|nr:hypothetical protein [Candidatus Woesearchaeota archaeon]MDP7458083.1 hypothetical protein [Candidatus Woesearchaeota archaeon]